MVLLIDFRNGAASCVIQFKTLIFFFIFILLTGCGFQSRKYTTKNYFDFHKSKSRQENPTPLWEENQTFATTDTSRAHPIEIIAMASIPLRENSSEIVFEEDYKSNYFHSPDTVIKPQQIPGVMGSKDSAIIQRDLKRVRNDNIGVGISLFSILASIIAIGYFDDVALMFLFSSMILLFAFCILSIIHHTKLKKHFRPFKNNALYQELNKKIENFSTLLKILTITGLVILCLLLALFLLIIMIIQSFH